MISPSPFWWALSPAPIRAFTSPAPSCSGGTKASVPRPAVPRWSWTAPLPPGSRTWGMLGQIEITPLHWAGFILIVLLFLSLDLGVFHRHAHVVQFREALFWSTIWFGLSLGFCGALTRLRSRQEALEFFTGYIIELSLSMDNVFVIAVIFA